MAAGIAVITAVIIAVVLHAPQPAISSNYVNVSQELGLFRQHKTVCQANERLPASTVALRISLISHVGPAVAVTVSHEGQIVASGRHGAGWVSASLTLPLHPQVTTPRETKICLTRGPGGLPVEISGDTAPRALAATVDGKPLEGRMRVEYLGRGQKSWLSLAKRVARRMGLGRSPSGTWVVLVLLAMMAAAVALGGWLLIQEASND